jgi:single-strand DNA-binding protein
MPNLNRVLLIGNLTRDPEVRSTPKGTAVADIGIATKRLYSGEDGERKEEVTFVDVTLWGRTAEVAQEYLKKSRQVFIEGRLQLDQWTDNQTGQKRSRLRVVAENMQMLGSRAVEQKPLPARPAAKQSTPPTQRQPSKNPELEPEPNDIPF